jgi:hypothetical protein
MPSTGKPVIARSCNVSGELSAENLAEVLSKILESGPRDTSGCDRDALIALDRVSPFVASGDCVVAKNSGKGFGGIILRCLQVEVEGKQASAESVAKYFAWLLTEIFE